MTKRPANIRRVWRILLAVLIAVVVLALVATSVYYALYWSGRAALFDRDNTDITAPESLVDSTEDEGKTVSYQGKTYRFKENVISLLFMGVDKTSIDHNQGYGKNGQADSLFLAVIDTKTGGAKVLPLSRETMVDVNLYSVNGTYAGVENTQLCLAYAYADTAEKGCENVIRSVGRLLYGMPVDGYIAIDMDGVAALNNAVGGVRVTVLEDLSFGPYKNTVILKKGQQIRLNDQTVLGYIRTRGEDADANNRRMARQKQFLNEFIRVAAANVKKDFTKIERYYTAAKPYAVSDLTLSEITYLASTFLVGGGAIEYLPVLGNSVAGEEYIEFYPDETSLYEAVLAAFYTVEN